VDAWGTACGSGASGSRIRRFLAKRPTDTRAAVLTGGRGDFGQQVRWEAQLLADMLVSRRFGLEWPCLLAEQEGLWRDLILAWVAA
jgi:hypothetical protein